MGDVLCAGCKEPWDTYHMKFDEVHEFLTTEQVEVWETALSEGKNPLSLEVKDPHSGKEYGTLFRELFSENGWKLGRTVFSILECPSCSVSDKSECDGEELEMLYYTEDLLGDDLDAIQTQLEDFHE